jgi:hypothetical protein
VAATLPLPIGGEGNGLLGAFVRFPLHYMEFHLGNFTFMVSHLLSSFPAPLEECIASQGGHTHD